MRGKLHEVSTTLTFRVAHPRACGENEVGATENHSDGAHPRACGENEALLKTEGPAKGSSPRMRGKLNQSPPRRAISGLIPAHAGKTLNDLEF